MIEGTGGNEHHVEVPQHALEDNISAERIPGRLYFDGEAIAVRSAAEGALLAALQNATRHESLLDGVPPEAAIATVPTVACKESKAARNLNPASRDAGGDARELVTFGECTFRCDTKAPVADFGCLDSPASLDALLEDAATCGGSPYPTAIQLCDGEVFSISPSTRDLQVWYFRNAQAVALSAGTDCNCGPCDSFTWQYGSIPSCTGTLVSCDPCSTSQPMPECELYQGATDVDGGVWGPHPTTRGGHAKRPAFARRLRW